MVNFMLCKFFLNIKKNGDGEEYLMIREMLTVFSGKKVEK